MTARIDPRLEGPARSGDAEKVPRPPTQLALRRQARHGTRPTCAALALCALATLPGCDEEAPSLVLAIRSRTPITSLVVQSKQYQTDGRVRLFPMWERSIDPNVDGYLVTTSGEPLRMQVHVPEPGRYAFHLVGFPIDANEDRLVADVCLTIDGSESMPNVFLGRLTPLFDADGDTFPESVEAFCASLSAAGEPCSTTCASPEFLSMGDCNPPEDYTFPERCAQDLGSNADWNPFVLEPCGDCHDQDCWGGDSPCALPEGCDGEEICGNGLDDNCTIEIPACTNGDVPCDDDRDGYRAIVVAFPGCGSDCNDDDPNINPGQAEGIDPRNPSERVNCDDGVDNNCNGLIDERCNDDLDDDGVPLAEDCNDCNAAVGPGFPERCGNSVDEDCSAGGDPSGDLACDDADEDGDGVSAEPVGQDCDDDDARSYPGAPDRCDDGIRSNCLSDGDCAELTDRDGDGFGQDQGDCDDEDPLITPWTTETCDEEGDDDDCDGQVNEVPPELAATRGCALIPEAGGWTALDFDSDLEHCGACRHACAVPPTHAEGTECVGGVCSCDGGGPCDGDVTDYCCPDGCRDLSADQENCGACGRACVRYELCLADPESFDLGSCACPSEGGLACDLAIHDACCPGVGCTDTSTDVANCGDCGASCLAEVGAGPRGDRCDGGCVCGEHDEVCVGNEWCTEVTEPPKGRSTCGCANLQDDEANCGECGHRCDPNEECLEGACSCSGSRRDCAGTEADYCCGAAGCVDRTRTTSHCGACNNLCASGETCVEGDCACGSRSCDRFTQRCCSGGNCYATLTDEQHCGPLDQASSCTNSCPSGSECDEGSCGCGSGGECDESETCCNFGGRQYCADLAEDASNCGTCGAECRAGEECLGDHCVCGADCDDGNSCTEDPCVGGRCEHHTNDLDDDGFCAASCPDAASGDNRPGDCANGDGDCDDANPNVNPGRTETCSTNYDDDCDGNTNDHAATGCTTFYVDADLDGYGGAASQCLCRSSGSYTTVTPGDCNDGNPSINPGATERCNDLDDDCNALTFDGSWECPTTCCGIPAACQECCDNADCPGGLCCSLYICLPC